MHNSAGGNEHAPLSMSGVTSHRSHSNTNDASRGSTWSLRHMRMVRTSFWKHKTISAGSWRHRYSAQTGTHVDVVDAGCERLQLDNLDSNIHAGVRPCLNTLASKHTRQGILRRTSAHNRKVTQGRTMAGALETWSRDERSDTRLARISFNIHH